jgi:hypothetical protein
MDTAIKKYVADLDPVHQLFQRARCCEIKINNNWRTHPELAH